MNMITLALIVEKSSVGSVHRIWEVDQDTINDPKPTLLCVGVKVALEPQDQDDVQVVEFWVTNQKSSLDYLGIREDQITDYLMYPLKKGD